MISHAIIAGDQEYLYLVTLIPQIFWLKHSIILENLVTLLMLVVSWILMSRASFSSFFVMRLTLKMAIFRALLPALPTPIS